MRHSPTALSVQPRPSPPISGPMNCEPLAEAVLSPIALMRYFVGTRLGIIAWREARSICCATANVAVNARTRGRLMRSVSARIASTPAAPAITLWVVLFPENEGQMAAFGFVQHNFFILFNALIGVVFWRRAQRELFDR